jgi:hypothetical protein
MLTIQQEVADSMSQVVAKVFGNDVTRAQLTFFFNLVADKANWKNPIDAVVSIDCDFDMAMIREAVIFFTGSVPNFTAKGRSKYRVTAQGYYVVCGA